MKKLLAAIILSIVCYPLAVPPSISYDEAFTQPLVHSESDKHCIAYTLHHEARGEPLKGLRAVYDSILARMKKRNKTACEVVLEKNQYSFVTKKKIAQVDEEMLTRLDEVGKIRPVVEGCEYFYANYIVPPKWVKKMEKCGKIGNHLFFKEKQK